MAFHIHLKSGHMSIYYSTIRQGKQRPCKILQHNKNIIVYSCQLLASDVNDNYDFVN